MNQPITLRDTPLNRLFLAINHYISTSNHLGEGIALGQAGQPTSQPRPDELLLIPLLVNTENPTDQEDYRKFAARFNQVAERFATRLDPAGRKGTFMGYCFVIRYNQCEELAQALTEHPGPLGWGSMKPLIEQHLSG